MCGYICSDVYESASYIFYPSFIKSKWNGQTTLQQSDKNSGYICFTEVSRANFDSVMDTRRGGSLSVYEKLERSKPRVRA